MPIELLFLNLAVHRDRTVRRRPSFHYAALPRSAKLCGEYVVEILDVDREVLLCAPLSCDCDEVGHHCWPKQFRSAVPYPVGARWLLVYEDERKLHEEWIPPPPRVVAKIRQDGDVADLSWRAEREGDADDAGCCEFWYLVQWFDAEDETWRGVAPRTRATKMRLPPGLLRGGEALKLRILASRGIATGVAAIEAKGRGRGIVARSSICCEGDDDHRERQITQPLHDRLLLRRRTTIPRETPGGRDRHRRQQVLQVGKHPLLIL